jgi:hypothetical protein
MSNEKLTHLQTVDLITETARTEALKQGSHIPTLLVIGTKGNVVSELTEMPDTHETRAQMLFDLGFNLAQENPLGIPVQLFFISEAWYSQNSMVDGELKMMPSQDPNRLEVLIIVGLQLIHAMHSTVILEMVRDETEQLLELREHRRYMEQGQVESPLLQAFLLGYQAGLKTNNHLSQFLS